MVSLKFLVTGNRLSCDRIGSVFTSFAMSFLLFSIWHLHPLILEIFTRNMDHFMNVDMIGLGADCSICCRLYETVTSLVGIADADYIHLS